MRWPTVQFHSSICAPLCEGKTAKARNELEKSERMTQKKSCEVLMEFSTCLLTS